MAKLIVNPSSSQKREILLPRTVLSIGRDPSNDLVLPDAMVSRRHAVVEWRGSQFYLRDCNSSNGSLVNGDRVSEKGLRDGDLVAIGTARLLFRDEAVGEEVGAKVLQHPSSKHMVCPSCSAEYRKGDLFCRQCGGSLAPSPPAKVVCAACGTAVPLPARFCNACGASLPAGALPAPAPAPPMPAPESLPATSGKASPAPAFLAPMPEEEPEVVSEAELRPATPAPFPAVVPDPKLPDPESRLADLPRASGLPRVRHMPARTSSPPSPPRPAPVSRPPAVPPSRAPLGARMLAGVADLMVVGLLQSLVLLPVARYWWVRELPTDPSEVGFLPILLSLGAIPLALGLGALYFVWGWGLVGATPGKKLLGLRVEGEDGRYPIGPGKAFARVLGYAASGLLVGVGFLLIPFTGDGLHDRIAGTRVVRREGD